MTNVSIDIVIPTYRLNESALLKIIRLPKPEGVDFHCYIVSDKAGAVIPESILMLQTRDDIQVLVHKQNLGPAAARNTGIRAGKSKWILFLDDDIEPASDLLFQYAAAISKNDSALGYAGLTRFPEPFNDITKALVTGGWTAHFTAAEKHLLMRWAPTANILLNREKMDKNLFDENLKVSGEDIDFLVRNSFLFSAQYIALPEAVVTHPWWNNGKIQTKRMWRYGIGASEISRKKPVSDFTFRDFTNSTESLFLILLSMPVLIFAGYFRLGLYAIAVVIIAEFLTNWLRGILTGKTLSPVVAFHLMWAKNCYEAGFFWKSVWSGHLNGFALRIDMGFTKPHPSPFRTNRWKIIKMILIAVLFLIALITFGAITDTLI